MAITFVIGRSGTGKTRRCFDAIVAELRCNPMGPRLFWLRPRQATFSAERELACNSGLGGFYRARVLSFQELGREILDDCGGSLVPEVTPLGRQMILGHLLRVHQPELKFFKSVARQPGLAARLDATFAEFERDGKDAADLDALLNQLSTGANAVLLDKVHDLHLIYHRYGDYLGQDRLDQHRRLQRVLSCIDQSRLFEGATIYVDGFTEFTAHERQMLARLGKKCNRVEITLRMDTKSPLLADPHLIPEDLSLFHSVEMTYRKLWFTFRQEETPVEKPAVLLLDNHRLKHRNLCEMERRLFDRAVVYVQDKEKTGIELLEAPDRRAEVDAAARRIQELLAAQYRLRDIAVIVRDLSQYHALIDASFKEHDIPYFADRRRATAHHPLPQFLRAVLMLAQDRWSHEWIMTLIKSGLANITATAADAMENYVLRHRIRGEQWASEEPWTFHASGIVLSKSGSSEALPAEEDPPTRYSTEALMIDHHRRVLVTKLRPFFDIVQTRRPLRQIATALLDVIERFEVRQQLVALMDEARAAEDFEQLGEHEQVWNKLCEMLEELVSVLGDEPVTLGAFHEMIESCLEHFEFAITPPTVDQVLVGQADRTLPPPLRAVLVLGLNEGIFPKVSVEDSVLSDADRRELHAREMSVSPSTDRRLLDENLLAYHACTCASDLLYASRVITETDGKPAAKSLYFLKLQQMFPKVPFTQVPREQRDDPALIGTPRQLVTGLMHWVRGSQNALNSAGFPRSADAPVEGAGVHSSQAASTDAWPTLYQWLANYPCDGSRLDSTRFTAWKALSADCSAVLSPDLAARLFPSPLQADVAQLETFAACPFKHFAQYGIGLKARDKDDGISAMDMSQVYHHVLDSVVRFLLRRHRSWGDLQEAQRLSLVRDAAQEIGQKLRSEVLLSTARNRYVLQRIENIAEQVIATQTAFEQRGRFRPLLSRVRFGQGGDASAGNLAAYSIRTPTGKEAHLRGKIDRVDRIEDGGEFAVIDYKLGSSQLKLDEIYHGLSLQLLTYLLVLEASGQSLPGTSLSPVAAFYVRVLRGLGDVKHPSEAIGPDDPTFPLQAKPRGLIHEEYLRDFDQAINGASEVIQATIKKDGSAGSKGKSDIAGPDEFAALLAHVGRRLGELADGILVGKIDIHPYMIRQQTPCPRCEFRSICRFESSGGGYRLLGPMDHESVLLRVLQEQPNGR